MTEGTRGHIADVIVALDSQRDEIVRLVSEAMQKYSMASEANDTGAQVEAFGEMESYTEAYAALRKATKILEKVWGDSKCNS